MIQTTVDKFGKIDCVINNAAFCKFPVCNQRVRERDRQTDRERRESFPYAVRERERERERVLTVETE